MNTVSKIKTTAQIFKISQNLIKEGKKIVYTSGCFDLLHMGHIELFRMSKDMGDILIVGIESSKSLKIYKQNKKILIFDDLSRLNIVASIIHVDYVFLLNTKARNLDEFQNERDRIIYRIRPKIVTRGLKKDKFEANLKKRVESMGVKFISLMEKKFDSSSDIVKKIKNSE